MRVVSKPAFLRHVLRKLSKVGMQDNTNSASVGTLTKNSDIKKHVCWPDAEGANLHTLVQCIRSNLDNQIHASAAELATVWLTLECLLRPPVG